MRDYLRAYVREKAISYESEPLAPQKWLTAMRQLTRTHACGRVRRRRPALSSYADVRAAPGASESYRFSARSASTSRGPARTARVARCTKRCSSGSWRAVIDGGRAHDAAEQGDRGPAPSVSIEADRLYRRIGWKFAAQGPTSPDRGSRTSCFAAIEAV